MSLLHERFQDYLQMRRALGFRLVLAEVHLRRFCEFMDARGATTVSSALALEWATSLPHIQPTSWAGRLSCVRQFGRYLQAFDPATEVPEVRLLPFRPKRSQPYHYTRREIRALMATASELRSRQTLRPWTLRTLIGLLSVTGMRLNEALTLTDNDVDLATGVLTVRGSKFSKSRLVPLHESTRCALQDYLTRRNACLGARPRAPYFLLTGWGHQFWSGQVYKAFRQISCRIGLRHSLRGRGPRLHDLRHRFATETLLRWSRSNMDIEREMPTLTTYLGHSNISDTYWYLSAHPRLLRHAALRLQRRWGGSR